MVSVPSGYAASNATRGLCYRWGTTVRDARGKVAYGAQLRPVAPHTSEADGKAAGDSRLAHPLLLHRMHDSFTQAHTDCFTHSPSIL